MPPENDEPTAFGKLLSRLARVPKREVDEEETREARNDARRKTPKPAAKPGHIVPARDTE
jgi:hypothetical protein